MRPVVAFPDAERAAIEYLAPHLPDGYTIDVRGAGGHFVRVRRVGGAEANVAYDHPTLDVMVWDGSDKLRMELAQKLWATLRAAAGDPTSSAVLYYLDTVLGPRQMPDPADATKTVAMFTVTLLVRAL